jgi:hypothetical protein
MAREWLERNRSVYWPDMSMCANDEPPAADLVLDERDLQKARERKAARLLMRDAFSVDALSAAEDENDGHHKNSDESDIPF